MKYPLLHQPGKLRRLVREGKTSREIAAMIGCNRKTVLERLREYGIDPRQGRPHEP